MSWTEDVATELARLDRSPRALRRFGLLVGLVLLGLAAWALLRRGAPTAGALLGAAGLALATLGAAAPATLRPLHTGWMTLALALGWLTSRLVLTVLFAVALVPLGLVARLAGKRFLETDLDRSAPSYWITRRPGRRTTYDKMF